MKILAAIEGKKLRSLNYKKTITWLQLLFVILLCCFGFIALSLCVNHNTGRFDQYSADADNLLTKLMEFSNEMDETKLMHRSMEKTKSSAARSSIYDYDHTSFINGKSSFFGSVMSEFACRVLSRHVTSSNILVIAPGAVSAAKAAYEAMVSKKMYTSNDQPQNYSVGGSFLQYGVFEGHAIHAINSFRSKKESESGKSGPTLDAWWSSFDSDTNSNNAIKWWWSTKPIEKPSWIILAVFDLDFGSEDSVWEEAESFLKGCTVTYIVIAIHSIKLKDGSYKFGGINAIESLLHRKYKLQTLSSSHYHTDKNNARDIFERYGPNALFQSTEELKGFLRWGADAAHEYDTPKDGLFTSYIFATQGLDLAIPTPQIYLRDGGTAIDVFNKYEMNNLPPLKSCPEANSERLDFFFNETSLRLNLSKNKSISYSQDELGQKSREEFQLWMNGISLSRSEAVCMRHRNGLSRCKTRISEKDISKKKSPGNNMRPNVLLVLLDPISRSHFDRSMPQTTATLADLNFVRFEKYTAVGPNSGPNQAALYSGTALEKRNQLHKNLSSGDKWLWDRLRTAGYVTLKGEDSCIENSNMMQSLAPNTTHGSALQDLFCFNAFARPNCIGLDLASSILFEYGHQFISTYEKLKRSTNRDLRWASFMHFVDSHEDTMLLSAILDPGLSTFLNKLNAEGYFENSVVILSSDHGLHYGPNFPSRQGRKEATEPILYMHVPKSLRHKVDMNVLISNSHLWTTPFDLHETLLELTQTSSNKKGARRRGLTLTEHLPASRKECKTTSDLIPSAYCNLQSNGTQEENSYGFCRGTLKRPTIDSFFLDIPPLNRRPRMNFDVDCHNTKRDLTEISKFDLCNQK